MTSSHRIAVTEESHVGVARRYVAEICARVSTEEVFRGRAAIVATEMTRNVVRHGKGGEIIVRQILAPTATGLELLALDRGPGLRNFAECLSDGFSTGGTTGSGLGAIKRLADRFEVFPTWGWHGCLGAAISFW